MDVFKACYYESDEYEKFPYVISKDKTANEDTTAFAEAMRVIGWEYEVKDISEDSYDMLMKKRKVALAYKDRFEGEDNGTWGDMLIEQTDYVLQGKEEYLKHLARYIYVCRK